MSTSTVDFLSKEGVATLWQTIKDYAVAKELLAQPRGVATLDEFGKVLQTQLPDYILGQVLFGGTIDGNGVATLTTLFKNRYNLSVATLDVDNLTAANYEGSYFIATANGVSGIAKTLDIVVGDWVISNGSEWTKIDNTDAVRTVLGLKGDIQAPDLRNAMLGKSGNQGSNLALGDIWMGNGDGTVVTHRTSIFARSILASIAENTMFAKLWADRATNDGNGKNIVNTYMPFAGGTFTGDVTHNANLILANSKVIVGKDTSGSNISLLSLNASNQVVIAYGAHNKYDTLIYGNKIIAYGDVCGQKGVSAKGIADFGLISGSGGGGGTAYTLNIVPSDSKVSIQLKGADGSSDTKEISIFSTSQAGIVAKAPSAGSVLRGNGWGTLAFSELASRPTTLGGYGITDAFTKSQIENGVFPNMRVGLADDLGDIEETLDEEYTFQPTANPNEIRDGYAQIESLKGNSLVWNQKIEVSQRTLNINGVSISIDSSGRITVSGTATDPGGRLNYVNNNIITLLPTHKYLFLYEFDDSFDIVLTQSSNTSKYIVLSYYKNRIFTVSETISGKIGLNFLQGNQYNSTSYIRLIDLTQMFGEGYEPTTVEEFYARRPKGMSMDYNDGQVIHFNGDIKSVGFNQWDEEWENGVLSAVGGSSGGTRIVTKNFIPILGGKSYYISGARLLYHEYDKDRNHLRIGNNNSFIGPNASITASPDAHYIKFYTAEVYGATYNHDICINLSDPDKNGTYEPYTEFRRDLPTELFDGGMKSAGTVHDEIYWDKAKGKYIKVKRIGEVDLGTLSWADMNQYNYGYRTDISSLMKTQNLNYNLSTNYKKYTNPSVKEWSRLDKAISNGIREIDPNLWHKYLVIKDSAYPNAATFKAAMSGVMLYYELAEPIVEEIDIPYMDYQVSNDGTEEIVSEVPTTPIKARVIYNFDTIGTVKQNRFDISTLRTFLPNGIANQAHKLATPRTIWGQSFDGSGNVDGNFHTSGEVFLDNGRSIRMKGSEGTNFNVLFVSGTDLYLGRDSPAINFGNSKMFINSIGNIGIGTTNPQYKLDVNGSFNALTGFIGGKNILHSGNTKLTLDAAYNWEDKNSQTNKQVYGFTLNVNGTEIGMSAITKEELEAMLV